MFEATASGIQLPYFMHAATDGAAPICSTTNQAKVLLIAVQELHVQPIQIYVVQTIRQAYGLQETCKCHFVEYTRGTWSWEKL